MKFEYTLMEIYIDCPLARKVCIELSPSTLAAPPHHHAEFAWPVHSPAHGNASQVDVVCWKCFLGLPPPHLYKLSRSFVKPHVAASDPNPFMLPPLQPLAVLCPFALQLIIFCTDTSKRSPDLKNECLLAVSVMHKLAMVEVADANAQHEPQVPWFLTVSVPGFIPGSAG
jgi:hypothetical protein